MGQSDTRSMYEDLLARKYVTYALDVQSDTRSTYKDPVPMLLLSRLRSVRSTLEFCDRQRTESDQSRGARVDR